MIACVDYCEQHNHKRNVRVGGWANGPPNAISSKKLALISQRVPKIDRNFHLLANSRGSGSGLFIGMYGVLYANLTCWQSFDRSHVHEHLHSNLIHGHSYSSRT